MVIFTTGLNKTVSDNTFHHRFLILTGGTVKIIFTNGLYYELVVKSITNGFIQTYYGNNVVGENYICSSVIRLKLKFKIWIWMEKTYKLVIDKLSQRDRN